MEELLDTYDINKNFLGTQTRSFCHSENPGCYHKAVYIWIKNKNNEILVQQKSLLKKHSPGKWDMPIAGHISAGENEITTCIREAKEELGLTTTAKDFKFVGEYFYKKGWQFSEIYLLKRDIDVTKLNLQTEEVACVKWFNYNDFIKLLFSDDFANHELDYRKLVAKLLK